MPSTRRVLTTSVGTSQGHFGPMEWWLVCAVSLIWGSSYLWIALGLDSFTPGVIAWLRLAFGVAVLTLLPRPRVRIERHDWRGLTLIAIAGNAVPAFLFALAEQTLESSVVGMLTAATPLVTLGLAVALGNRSLRPVHAYGLGLGGCGVILMSVDSAVGAETGVAGIAYVMIAIVGYAITSNVTGPLAEQYGPVAVIVRAQAIALVAMTPFGLAGLSGSTFTLKAFIAVAILGVFGTGMARSLYAALIARSGAPRAAVVGYLVPLVAAVLGIVILNERLTAGEAIGLVMVSTGAFLATRRIKRNAG